MRNQKLNAMRRIVTLIGILGIAAAIVGTDLSRSSAQAPFGGVAFGTPASQQINNPAVSPYLNLTQPGLNPGVAYQTLIAPQMQLGNAVANNQQQITNLQGLGQPLSALQPPLPSSAFLETGHPTTFLDTFGYFPTPKKGH
jgi:hypothetical protein